MKTRFLPFILGFFLLGRAAMDAGTVSTTITPAGTASACFNELDVTLIITSVDCDITLQGVPGTVLSFDSASGFVQGEVSFNIAQDVATVTLPTGTLRSGTITFKLALTGCHLYSLPPDNAGLRHVKLTTSFPCPTPQSSFVDIPVNLPTLQIVLNPAIGLSSLNGGNFLMNQVVDRYYAVEVPSGIVDFFTFKIQPEPGIEVQRVDAVDVNGAFKFQLFLGAATTTISLGFGGTGFPIAQCNASGLAFLDASVGDYIILRERIKITACSVTGEPETVIEAALDCDENTATDACWTDTEQLSVNCLQKGTSLDLSLSDNTTFGAVPGFPSISLCAGAAPIEYVIFLNNRVTSGSSLPAGAGSRALASVKIPINGDYFTYSDIRIQNTTLIPGVHYKRNGVGTSGDVALIDFTTLTADPDGAGNGLTDVVGSLGVAGRFNLLEENRHVTIVLEGFEFWGASKLAPCNQSAFPYSLDSIPYLYLTVTNRDMCTINDPDPRPQMLYDAGWQARNRFGGYCYGLSDNADVAPGTAGHESANLTYTFYSTGTSTIGAEWITPFSISQRPFTAGNIIDMIKCLDVRYQAVIKMPNGFQVTGSQVEVRDPLNPLFGPVTLPVTGTYPDLIVDYTGLNGNPLMDGNSVPLVHPAQVSLTFNVKLTCGGTVPLFGVASFPLEFRAVCDPSCNPAVYRTMCCSSIDIFFHCPGSCGSPVGTKNFDLARITPGWISEADFESGVPPNATIQPSLENRVYQCDQVVATSTMGQAGPIPANGDIAFELAYEPPTPPTGVNGANIFLPESASFTFDDGNGNSFTLPMQSSHYFPKPIDNLDRLVIIPDVTVLVTVQSVSQTAKVALENGAYTASFTGTFRIVDANSPTLNPTFHIMHLVFGQFLVVNPTAAAAGIYDVIHNSCDAFCANLVFLKTESSLERNQLLPPGYNVAFDRLSPVDQCLLRYAVVARTYGGFAARTDFEDLKSGAYEFRPGLGLPNHIEIQWPSGYRFHNAGYAEGSGASGSGTLGPWTTYVNDVVFTLTSVEISNIHSPLNYPGSISIEKQYGLARQAVLVTLVRECPLEDPPIDVLDLDLATRVYSPDATCHDDLMSTQPPQVTYFPGAEVHDITMTTVPQTLGNLNPITVPVYLNHFGNGTGVNNAWVYFTPVSGNIISITPSSSVGSWSADGLYHLGTLPNSPVKVDVKVVYDCTKLVNGQLVFDPTPIEIMATYGNSCFGYPTLVSGFIGNTNTDFVLPYLPCLAKQETFKILPQPAGLILVPGAPIPGNCGDVSFDLQAKSTGSDVKGVIMLATPPNGYVLNPNCSTIEGQSLAAILLSHPTLTPQNDAWDISLILLTLFGQSTFFFDPQNIQNNPLDFRLCYSLTDCTMPAGPQFEFSMSGISACGEPVAQSLIPVPFSYVPPTAPAATVTATLDPVTDCTNALRLTIDLAGITYAGNLKATVTATFDPAFGFVASSLAPLNTGAGVIDWVVNPVAGSSLNITADLSIPAKFCKAFPVSIAVKLEDVTACCTRTVQYTVTASQLICCATNCCDVCLPDANGQYPASYTVTVYPGYNHLARNLCHGTNNILDELMPFVSDDDYVLTFDEATQSYDDPVTYLSGAWYDGNGTPVTTVTVTLGEGYVFYNSGLTPDNILFTGCEPTNCPLPCLPTNMCVLVGRHGIGTAAWTDLSSCPPECVRVSIFNPITQTFANYDYVNGGWTPQNPVLAIGQAAFVCPLDPTNCCTNAQSFVANGSFEVTSPVMTPNTFNHSLDSVTGVPGWTTTAGDFLEVWCNPFGSIPASTGTNQLEINAQSTDQTVSQVVTGLNTNCPATFCFDYTGRFGLAGGTPNNDFTVTLSGGASLSLPLDPVSYYSGAGWMRFCTNFLPASSAITIAFRGNPHSTANGDGGAHIDNVSVTQCCPLVPPCPPSPALNIAFSAGNIVLSWSGPGYRLECATALAGTGTVWSSVPGTSLVMLPASGPQKFFRLVCP